MARALSLEGENGHCRHAMSVRVHSRYLAALAGRAIRASLAANRVRIRSFQQSQYYRC